MDYVVDNQYGVITVNEKATMNQPKEIRFINSNYDLLFMLPDKGYIQINFVDGEKRAYQCSYLDSYHVLVGTRAYHICEFAESMERIGATYAECPDKHIVWSDMDLNIKDWRDYLSEEYGYLDDDTMYEKMVEINAGYLDDERANLKQPIGGTLVIIADLGLWDGRRQGYKLVKNAKLSDCLDYRYDSAEWYVTRDGEFCGSQAHHDGTNHYVYRKVKAGVSDEELGDLLMLLYDNKATQEDIDKVTEKLGKQVAQVYDYELPDTIIKQKEKTKGGDAR